MNNYLPIDSLLLPFILPTTEMACTHNLIFLDPTAAQEVKDSRAFAFLAGALLHNLHLRLLLHSEES